MDEGQRPFHSHPTTWLNREGWNDVMAGEKASLSQAEIDAANKRARETKEAHDRSMAQLTEENRRRLGMTS